MDERGSPKAVPPLRLNDWLDAIERLSILRAITKMIDVRILFVNNRQQVDIDSSEREAHATFDALSFFFGTSLPSDVEENT